MENERASVQRLRVVRTFFYSGFVVQDWKNLWKSSLFRTFAPFYNTQNLRQTEIVGVDNFMGINKLLWVRRVSREVKVCLALS